MGPRCALLAAALALAPTAAALAGDSIDGRVVQVRMPLQDVTLYYVETTGGMMAELRAASASVAGTKLYVGDGEVALELRVVSGEGMVFQGGTEIKQGFEFKKGRVIKVLPGYKRAAGLRPGDVYVRLPAVVFDLPAE